MSSSFSTIMRVPDDANIFALSDIHADIDALIISLRDCAKVIRKNPTKYNTTNNYGIEFSDVDSETNIRKNNNDEFLEYLLQLNLNNAGDEKIFNDNLDLGYEWIGGNSHVVIVGDILDGARIKAKKFFN